MLRDFIEHKREEYHQTYGSVRNFADFLDKYFVLDDQVRFVLSIRPMHTRYVIRYSEHLPGFKRYENLKDLLKDGRFKSEKGFQPVCYNWKECFVEGSCRFPVNTRWCRLFKNGQIRQSALKRVANIFYGMRSKFIHDAKVLPISKNLLAMYDKKPIVVNFTIVFLEEVFEKAFRKFFEVQTG